MQIIINPHAGTLSQNKRSSWKMIRLKKNVVFFLVFSGPGFPFRYFSAGEDSYIGGKRQTNIRGYELSNTPHQKWTAHRVLSIKGNQHCIWRFICCNLEILPSAENNDLTCMSIDTESQEKENIVHTKRSSFTTKNPENPESFCKARRASSLVLTV
jgi:hypothetical protein